MRLHAVVLFCTLPEKQGSECTFRMPRGACNLAWPPDPQRFRKTGSGSLIPIREKKGTEGIKRA